MGASNFINQSAPSFMNAAFGFSLVNTNFGVGGSSAINPADVAGTAFDGGPTPVPNHNGTHPLTSGLPAGTLSLYLAFEGTTNAIMPFGSGKIMYLGWDWFDGAPLGSSDDGWIDILDRAITECEATAECFTLDFETDDEGQPLVHGQHLGNGDPEFDGGASFPVTITSSVNASNLPTAAVLDSDTGPAAQDPDLLVGRGNILILQTDANTSECPPASGIYCSHNDDEDGGTLSFGFPGPITPASVVLIDIDSSDGTSTVVLTDGAGAQRTYSVPANWTGDFMSDGPPGWKLLDLTDTNGQIGFGSTATAVDDPGFDPTGVLQIDINLAHSGGVDDLSWCETGVAMHPPPSVQRRNGSGVNHVILSSGSLPLIGGTWAANLDCRGFGSGLATLTVCRRATYGTMTPFGEQLIAGALFLRSGQVFAGSVSQFTWAIPNDPALIGLDLHAQGLCWSTQGALGPKTMRARKGLSNALDLIVGF